MSNSSLRPNQPPIKVLGVGLGRTGTLSLCLALEKLGFGPCYHPLHCGVGKAKWLEWTRVLEGETDPTFIDAILEGYTSAVDSPVALNAEAMYNAYPNAKFILTTREVEGWVKSMKTVIFGPIAERDAAKERLNRGTATDEDREMLSKEFYPEDHSVWGRAVRKIRYKGQNPFNNTNVGEELLSHNEYIKKLIPHERLLEFDVREGWGPLARFLGVPEPDEPFPKANETKVYWDNVNGVR